MEKEPIVISVGGSLIVPGDIDTAFLKTFVELISSKVAEGYRFVIIAGGGKTARVYRDAAQTCDITSSEALDWIGIYGTYLNASLLLALFGYKAASTIGKIPLEQSNAPILVGGGRKPGQSSDAAMIQYAREIGAHRVINLSNIDYVYTKDPNKFPDAEPIKEISWANFRTMIPTEWDPGLSSPFDPVASREAEEASIEVAIMNGKNLEGLKNYIEEKEFVGTRIK